MAGRAAGQVTHREADAVAERAARSSYGRLVALLAASTGTSRSLKTLSPTPLKEALRTWPVRGIPDNPQGWLVTVARNRIRDVLASATVRTAAPLEDEPAAALARADLGTIPDKRLELLFASSIHDQPGGAHPAHAPGRTRLRRQALHVSSRSARRDGTAPGASKAPDPRCGHPLPGADASGAANRLPSVLEAIYGAYAIDWLDQHERIHESMADEARWLAVLTASLLDTAMKAGRRSALRAGRGSALRAGRGSAMKAGRRSAMKAGRRSALRAGRGVSPESWSRVSHESWSPVSPESWSRVSHESWSPVSHGIESLFEHCTIALGEGTEFVIGRGGVLSGCQIRGAGRITIHGKFVEQETPGIVGVTQLVVSAAGSLVGAVEQPPEQTRFAFEPGCMLRVKIQQSKKERSAKTGRPR